MSRTIMTFTPQDGVPIEIDANTLEKFKVASGHLYPISAEPFYNISPIRILEYGFNTLNGEQDVVFELKECGDVLASIPVDEKRLCQALFNGIYLEGKVIDEIPFVNDLKKTIRELYLRQCFEDKTNDLYEEVNYQGFGFIRSGENQVIGTIDGLTIHKEEEYGSRGVTLEKCVGALDLNLVPNLNIVFGNGEGLITLRNIVMDKFSSSETCQYEIHVSAIGYRRREDETPQVPPYESFSDDEEFIANRLPYITTETEENNDEFEDLL